MFDRLTVKQKISLGFALVFVILILGTISSTEAFENLYEIASSTARKDEPHMAAVLNVKYYVTEGHLWFEEILSGDENEQIEDVYAIWNEARNYTNVLLNGGELNGRQYLSVSDPDIRPHIEVMRDEIDLLIQLAEQRYQGTAGVTGSDLDQQFDDVYTGIIEHADNVETRITNKIVAGLGTVEATYARNTRDTRLAFGGIVVMFVVIAIWIGREVAKPMRTLVQAAGKMAEGHYEQRVDVHARDEIGRLGEAFNVMAESIERAAHESAENSRRSQEAARHAEAAQAEAEEQRAYLSRSVDHILEKMNRFSKGDLSVRIDTDGQGEIGKLFEGFNGVVGTVRRMMHEVEEAVVQTTESAHRIGSTAERLAAGSRRQSAQSGEVAAAIAQMSASIVDNARSATRTAEVTRESGMMAEEGGAVVQQTVDKIRKIAGVVQHAAEIVERLGASSAQIGEIVSVIREIADQTNLLALNAAIEAARAGEQGKGFAVVADEVRKLAERTADSTRQIAEMITKIQQETGAAVSAMKQGTEQVDEGIALADKAGRALGDVVTNVQEAVGMVSQIAAATEEQSTTSTEISSNVEAIAVVAQEAAEGITDIVDAAQSLNELTGKLNALVAKFNVGAQRGITETLTARPIALS